MEPGFPPQLSDSLFCGSCFAGVNEADELDGFVHLAQRRESAFYCHWPSMALCHLHLQNHGLRQLRTARPGRAAHVLAASNVGRAGRIGSTLRGCCGPPWALWRGALCFFV